MSSAPDQTGFDRRHRKRLRHRQRSVFWPVVLIAVGLIFLLQNFGLLSWNVWSGLWRLWPVLLVILGIELIFRDLLPGGIGLALAVVLIFGVIAAAVFFSGSLAPAAPSASSSTSQSLNGARRAGVRIDFGAGQLNVGALDGSGDQLSSLTYQGPQDLQPQATYQVNDGVGQLTYGLASRQLHWFPFTRPSGSPTEQVLLAPSVPLTLNVQEGASDSHIDLSKLDVSDLRLQTGASTTWLRLPQAARSTTARIQGGAATLTIEVPDGVAAQIRYRGGLSNVNVDTNRFPSTGSSSRVSTYRSPDYDSAQNKVDLDIQTGVATVTVR